MRDKTHVLPSAVLIVFKKNDRILMGRRKNGRYANGFLCPPAGGLESGESFAQAAIREAREEVGVVISVDQLKPFHFMYCRNLQGLEWLNMYFLVEDWVGEFVIAEPDKCSELIWVDASELPNDVVPEIKQGIIYGLLGTFYSESRSVFLP